MQCQPGDAGVQLLAGKAAEKGGGGQGRGEEATGEQRIKAMLDAQQPALQWRLDQAEQEVCRRSPPSPPPLNR